MSNPFASWTEALILINCVLSALCAIVLIALTMMLWDHSTWRERRRQLASIVLMFVLVYSAGEAAQQNVRPGLRFAMFLVAIACFLTSLLWGFRDDVATARRRRP